MIELGLNRKGSALRSDGAKCFENAAKEFNMHQVRCLKHFRGRNMEASAGMQGDQALLFEHEVERLYGRLLGLMKRWKMLLMNWKMNTLEPAK